MNVGRADLLAGGLRGSVRLSLRRMVLLAQQVHALLEKELDEVHVNLSQFCAEIWHRKGADNV